MQAFHNQPELKTRLLAQLQAHIDAGELRAWPTLYREGSGSPVACLTHDSQLAAFAPATGIPNALGAFLDTMATFSRDEQALGVYTREWISAIPVGADLRPLAHALLAWLLEDTNLGATAPLEGSALAGLRHTVAAMHRRAMTRPEMVAGEWKAVRETAVAVTNALTDARLAGLAAVVEASAWDPATSSTVVSDSVRAWVQGLMASPLSASEMTQDDEVRIHARLRELFAEAVAAGQPEATIDAFAMLQQRDPELARRAQASMAERDRVPADCVRLASERLLALTRALEA